MAVPVSSPAMVAPVPPADDAPPAGNARRRYAAPNPGADGGCRQRGRRRNCRWGSHGELGALLPHGGEGLLEGRARQARHRRKGGASGEIGIGAKRALEGDGAAGIAHCLGLRARAGAARLEQRARAFEIGRSIDTEGNHVNEGHVDAHPRLQRAQLLQLLALLEPARRQLDEARQSGAAIGIDADVVIERPLAPRDRQPA